MRPDLALLVEQSEGSQLISYTFENRVVRFQLFHERRNALLTFEAPTDTVYGRSVPLDSSRARCRIVLGDLRQMLFVRNGKYVASVEPEVCQSESRRHLNLAYGRREIDLRWILTLKGEYNLLCILLRDLDDLQWVAE